MLENGKRLLGLDVGDRRIGIAVTDALGMAQPLITMGRSSPKQEIKNLGRLLRKHSVRAIVVGRPLHMSGEAGTQTAKCESYATVLREAFAIPIHMQDERLSSAEADAWLDRRGVPRGAERKAVLDRVAAMIILQDWIDAEALRDGVERDRA